MWRFYESLDESLEFWDNKSARKNKKKGIVTMIQAYFIRFRLYGVNNVMHFRAQSQYLNWQDAMKTNFQNQFEVIEIIPYDI